MVLNCKVCGGSLKMVEGSSVCRCEYCGKEQTIPKTDDEQMLSMLNRANHFRQIYEFDKAIEIYERLLNNGNEDAEVYWSLALCRYGIEYVDDPKTLEKIPTCHRTQYTSILGDADYLMAIKNADPIQKSLFEQEAGYIDKIQKEILEISNKEAPFDVFICYKESDGAGNRTNDSVLAQDIYFQLTSKGYKVFFSRITLENKVGQQYEPYIFAALNSARVMIIVGTKPEYFNAVWVKNEWNRFLALSHDDKSRLVIPAFKDMDPYDLPDALSYFQALDMAKIGFVQDLVRGIEKVLNDNKQISKTEEQRESTASGNAGALLKRGRFALEDAEWDKAYEYYDQLLNFDAENGEAYLGLVLAEMNVLSLEELVRQRVKLFREKLTELYEIKVLQIEDDKADQFDMLLKNLKESDQMDFYMNLSDCQKSYKTSVPGIERYIKEEETFFDTNKNVQKGSRFSQKVNKELREAREAILSEMKIDLEAARKEEADNISQSRQIINGLYEKKVSIVMEAVQKKRDKYEDLKKQYITSGGFSDTKRLLEEFKKMAHYRDVDEIIDKLTDVVKQKEKRLDELNSRHKEILYHGFSNIKGFGKKRQEQEDALRKEMKMLECEIKRLSD